MIRERMEFLATLPTSATDMSDKDRTYEESLAADRPDAEYDVALSFAGEDREYVSVIAQGLTDNGVRVFYDEYEAATLWGKNLYVHLREVYFSRARYTVLFASKDYARKAWTNHERESAQARALKEHREYILPVRIDDTAIPGLLDTTGYVDTQTTTPAELIDMLLAKLGRPPTSQTGNNSVVGEARERESPSLRSRAVELARKAQTHQARKQHLATSSAIAQAKQEVVELFDYISREVAAIVEVDSQCGLAIERRGDLILVRSPTASVTLSWRMEFLNSLKDSALFVRELDGMHSLDSFGPKGEAVNEVYARFDVDDRLQPRWYEETIASRFYTTEQLADKYLGRVIERVFHTPE